MKKKRQPYVLDRMMAEVGMPVKNAYRIGEVSRASGVPLTTLNEDAKAGTIKTFLPPGRKRGRLVKPEWFEDWWKEGMENAG